MSLHILSESPAPQHPAFNRTDQLVEGWYWALPSRELKKGQARALSMLGRELVVYRGEDGAARILDAFCPHMGAHLAEGRVEGTGIRCFFHDWKFDPEGRCVDIPCQEKPVPVRVRSWPVEERYGMIWLWTGETARKPVPFVPELEGVECDAAFGNRFVKNCHPNVVMINAIDAQHFNSVHNLPVRLRMDATRLHDNAIQFSNGTRVEEKSLFTRFIARFYQGSLTYSMCYWFGTTGSVTVGPDFMHFHIVFALRPTMEGHTEGQTLLLTRSRKGPWGWLFNRAALFATRLVGDHFAKGDTRVFQTIRFQFRTPIKADQAILQFIDHLDQQRVVRWGSWEDAGSPRRGEALSCLP